MAAITSAVTGAAIALKGQRDAKKAGQAASRRSEQAAIKSANILAEAGSKSDKNILKAQQEAAVRSGLGTEEAAARLQPFLEPGQEAFRQAQELSLSGADIGGPLADSLRQASLGGINERTFDLSGPVGAEAQRQAGIAVSGLTPQFRGNLLTAGQQGIAATGDVASIRSRGLDTLADIAGATGAQRASVLVGAGPELQQLSSGAQEARLLGDVASQRFQQQSTETLARLAGRVT